MLRLTLWSGRHRELLWRQASSTALPTLVRGQTEAPACVEKHLVAAWVLIIEHQNGYPYRLPAIGHLHCTEEDS